MKNKFRDRSFFLFVVSLLLLICRNQGLSADFYFGYNYGYSLALKQINYDEFSDFWATSYASPRLKNCQRFYVQFFPKESNMGFSVEVFKQAYDNVTHSERWTVFNWTVFNGIEKTGIVKSITSNPDNFVYIMIGADYRFFADIDRRFNPYLNLSFMALCYINIFGSGPPSYPNQYDFKCGAGIKYKLVPGILLNSNLSYFVGNSILSLQLGLEFCF